MEKYLDRCICIMQGGAPALASLIRYNEGAVSVLSYVATYHYPSDAPPHGVFALHACDVATDEALAYGVEAEAAALLVAPCCQAELAASWKAASRSGAGEAASSEPHPFAAVHEMPHVRREVAASVTDAMRVLLLKACGFSVKLTEFVAQEHTPKNTLITAMRQRPANERGGHVRTAKAARRKGLAE